MSKQYYHVVYYDDVEKEWSVDFEVSLNYDNGRIWDTKEEGWTYLGDDDETEDAIIEDLKKRLQ